MTQSLHPAAQKGFSSAAELYQQRTGLDLNHLQSPLSKLRQKKLLLDDTSKIACTEQGHIFLNSVLESFL